MLSPKGGACYQKVLILRAAEMDQQIKGLAAMLVELSMSLGTHMVERVLASGSCV